MFMISSFLLVAFSRLELGDDIVYKFNVQAVCEPHVYPGDSAGLVFVELLSISRRDRRSDSEPAPPWSKSETVALLKARRICFRLRCLLSFDVCETVCTLNPATATTQICPFTWTMTRNEEEPLLTVPIQRHNASLQEKERRSERARWKGLLERGIIPHLGPEKGEPWWECAGIILEWVGTGHVLLMRAADEL